MKFFAALIFILSMLPSGVKAQVPFQEKIETDSLSPTRNSYLEAFPAKDGSYFLLKLDPIPISFTHYNKVIISRFSYCHKKLWSQQFLVRSPEPIKNGKFAAVSDSSMLICLQDSFDNAFVINFSFNGKTNWAKRINITPQDSPPVFIYSLICTTTRDGGFVVAAQTQDESGSIDHFALMLIKFDVNGNNLWFKKFGEVKAGAYSVGIDESVNGDIAIMASTYRIPNDDHYILKVDASGQFLWYKEVGGSPNFVTYSSNLSDGAMDEDGNIYLQERIFELPDKYPIIIFKVSPTGNFIWGKHIQEKFYTSRESGRGLEIVKGSNISFLQNNFLGVLNGAGVIQHCADAGGAGTMPGGG